MKEYVTMPTKLTAENGAKALLIGEFYEEVDEVCPECGGEFEEVEGGDENCFECEGTGKLTRRVYVKWSTIKEIYEMAMKNLAT